MAFGGGLGEREDSDEPIVLGRSHSWLETKQGSRLRGAPRQPLTHRRLVLPTGSPSSAPLYMQSWGQYLTYVQ